MKNNKFLTKLKLEFMLMTTFNEKGLDMIGETINKSLEKGYNVFNYQVRASKKMRKIYNRIGEYVPS